MRSVKRNCVSSRGLAYDDCGDGPSVLLIHAFGLDADMWHPQVAHLLDHGYRAITPDLRGFGASPRPPRGFAFSTVVSDMIDILDSAGVERALVVGLSMGAATAVAVALDHPDRVAGLLIADNSRPDGPVRAEAAARRITELGLAGLADVYEPILFGDLHRSQHPEAISEWRRRLLARNPQDLAVIVRAYHNRPDPGPRLGEVKVPTLLVFGEEDAAIPEERRGDYRSIPGLEEHRIQRAGHVSNLEVPEAFNRLLLPLADRTIGQGSSADEPDSLDDEGPKSLIGQGGNP